MTTPIKLTEYQREEIWHLHDIAEGEVRSHIERDDSPDNATGWMTLRNALDDLLRGEPMTPAYAEIALAEVEWHLGKPVIAADRGLVTSLNGLTRKLRNAIKEKA